MPTTTPKLRASWTRRPRGDFWIFAYGSLIWKPACEFDRAAHRPGRAAGTAPSASAGTTASAASETARPDAGARSRRRLQGRALPPARQDRSKPTWTSCCEREMSMAALAFPRRWINVATGEGPLTRPHLLHRPQFARAMSRGLTLASASPTCWRTARGCAARWPSICSRPCSTSRSIGHPRSAISGSCSAGRRTHRGHERRSPARVP